MVFIFAVLLNSNRKPCTYLKKNTFEADMRFSRLWNCRWVLRDWEIYTPPGLWCCQSQMTDFIHVYHGYVCIFSHLKLHYSFTHDLHTHTVLVCLSCLPFMCLLSSFLSWVPEVQRAWKVNKTPLMSHVEHTMSADWKRERKRQRERKGKKSDATRRFLYPIWPVCCTSFIYAVIVWSLSSRCCTHSCQIRSISVSPGWSQLKTTPHAMACFSVPISSLSLVRWHRPSSLRAFHLNKCVCN